MFRISCDLCVLNFARFFFKNLYQLAFPQKYIRMPTVSDPNKPWELPVFLIHLPVNLYTALTMCQKLYTMCVCVYPCICIYSHTCISIYKHAYRKTWKE